jgi:hypothetical protein
VAAPGRVAVLDVESVPDADALAQAPRHSNGGHARPALHRLIAATVVTCDEGPRGFTNLDLRTFAHPDQDELDIIGYVDLLLPDPTQASSRLVTWNGGHDLRLLRHRACSRWMFGARTIHGWSCRPAGQHVDVMEEVAGGDRRGRWALADFCAGLGFAIRSGISGRPVRTLHTSGRHDAVAEHNRLDAVGTFLAYGYQRAFETGDERFAATAWDLAADALAPIGCVDANVQSLADHHLASIARHRLTAPGAPPRVAAGARGR